MPSNLPSNLDPLAKTSAARAGGLGFMPPLDETSSGSAAPGNPQLRALKERFAASEAELQKLRVALAQRDAMLLESSLKIAALRRVEARYGKALKLSAQQRQDAYWAALKALCGSDPAYCETILCSGFDSTD